MEHPQNEISIVFLPTSIMVKVGKKQFLEKLLRICYFLKWHGNSVGCQDSGLLLGKSGRIYPNLKHREQKYIYPAERTIFCMDGGRA